MPTQQDVPVERCAGKRQRLRRQGFEVISCDPKPDDPKTCVIVYQPRPPKPAAGSA